MEPDWTERGDLDLGELKGHRGASAGVRWGDYRFSAPPFPHVFLRFVVYTQIPGLVQFK